MIENEKNTEQCCPFRLRLQCCTIHQEQLFVSNVVGILPIMEIIFRDFFCILLYKNAYIYRYILLIYIYIHIYNGFLYNSSGYI